MLAKNFFRAQNGPYRLEQNDDDVEPSLDNRRVSECVLPSVPPEADNEPVGKPYGTGGAIDACQDVDGHTSCLGCVVAEARRVRSILDACVLPTLGVFQERGSDVFCAREGRFLGRAVDEPAAQSRVGRAHGLEELKHVLGVTVEALFGCFPECGELVRLQG
jgi:hypothetical protein